MSAGRDKSPLPTLAEMKLIRRILRSMPGSIRYKELMLQLELLQSKSTARDLVLQRFPHATCELLPDTMMGIWPNDGSDVKGCLGIGNDEEEAWQSAYRNAVGTGSKK